MVARLLTVLAILGLFTLPTRVRAAGDKEALEAAVKAGNRDGFIRTTGSEIRWYRKATDQGEAAAQNNLGFMYQIGRGVEKSEAEAVKWYRKAAEQGHAAAQNALGFHYDAGRGVPQNMGEAVKWFRLAAEQGEPTALCNLGYMYENGRGVEKNLPLAVKWYRQALAKGNANARQALVNLGVDPRDFTKERVQ